MSRIIKTQNGYQIREKALKLIGKAISESEYVNNNESYIELASFIALSLDEIENSIRETTAAWEKRDYWVKADQFRAEWSWVGQAKDQLVRAIKQKDLQKIGEVFEALRKNRKILEGMVKVRKGVDYSGSYSRFRNRFG
ncbi:MAG: hypothetical protein ANABAC_0193 [Anaerolineae bacterium]|jgi:hypothetical protein|nr:MAG: hypothetical protein ANABAC_0193 [Anaerolineae bacterium]